MQPIKAKYLETKKALTNIEISIGPVSMDVSQMFDPPMPEICIQEVQSLVFKNNGISVFRLSDIFSPMREEVLSNLSIPISISEKESYLIEILNFYSNLEERIVEDEFGILSTDIFKVEDSQDVKMLEIHQNEYKEFLSLMKDSLRREIVYITNQVNLLGMKNTNPQLTNPLKDSNIIWKRDKGDLIELVKALCLIGAINNSTNNLSETEAYKVFGNLLGIELKRPSDIIKNKSKYHEKEYFLEELHAKFQEHLLSIRE